MRTGNETSPGEVHDGAAFWEAFYAGREPIWSGRANPLLVENVAGLTPGTALDVGTGEGGDAIWLAAHGWTVTAVDIGTAALERLHVRARDEGLEVRTARHDLAREFPDGTYDLVSAQYLHSPAADFPRGAVLRAAARAVAPGGTLLVVGHGRLAPWSWDPDLVMPTAADVLADLDLAPGAWTVERADAPEREAEGPDGQIAPITDEVVLARRR